MLQAKWTLRCPDSKEGQISLQRLNACSSFISQDERMSESPVETLQKALSLHLILKRGLTSLWKLVSHVKFTDSKGDDAWQFLNIVRNPSIIVSNRKWSSVSLLTSRRVHIFLTSLPYITEVSIITRQECWRCWRNTSIEIPTRHNSRIYPTFLPQLEKIHETSPSARDEAQFPLIACSAIPCCQYNTKGAWICLMELQRVRKNNLTSLEWHWCHQRNVKLFDVTQINLRWRPTLLYWI